MTTIFTDFSVIAEIGVNHEGDFSKAEDMVRLAAEGGADFVKFQSYTPERFISADDPDRLARVSKFSLHEDDFSKLSNLAKDLGIGFLSTPVTEDWIEFLDQICPAFKIASGDIDFKPVILGAAKTGKPLIISTGTSSLEEIDQAVKWVSDEVGKENLYERLILMHCISAYPTPIEQANILSIPFMKERYKLRIGYSNHVIGSDACLAAVAHGADIIEVHFTYRKEDQDFHDHKLSFDVNDLKQFIQTAKNIRASLGEYKKERAKCETVYLPFRKGLIAASDLEIGHVLTKDDFMYARPATEFGTAAQNSLIGKTIQHPVSKGHTIKKFDIEL